MFAQSKHEPKVKAVREIGKITEVKQSALRIILICGDHTFLSFFNLVMIGRNIRQIWQILLIGVEFQKNSFACQLTLTG